MSRAFFILTTIVYFSCSTFVTAEKSTTHTRQYSNGAVYVGTLRNNKPHGNGEMSLPNGYVYKGEFRNGEIEGRGSAAFPNGLVVTGHFKKGTAQGPARFEHSNGMFAEANAIDGSPPTDTTWTFINGSTIKYLAGPDGHNTGSAQMTWPNGSFYEGETQNYLPWGKGRLQSETAVYTGNFENGLILGQGKMSFLSPTSSIASFEGYWIESKPFSGGVLTYRNGIKFEGKIDQNFIPADRGTFVYPDGSSLSGPIKNGRINGMSTITYSNGNQALGNYLGSGFVGNVEEGMSDGSILLHDYGPEPNNTPLSTSWLPNFSPKEVRKREDAEAESLREKNERISELRSLRERREHELQNKVDAALNASKQAIQSSSPLKNLLATQGFLYRLGLLDLPYFVVSFQSGAPIDTSIEMHSALADQNSMLGFLIESGWLNLEPNSVYDGPHFKLVAGFDDGAESIQMSASQFVFRPITRELTEKPEVASWNEGNSEFEMSTGYFSSRNKVSNRSIRIPFRIILERHPTSNGWQLSEYRGEKSWFGRQDIVDIFSWLAEHAPQWSARFEKERDNAKREALNMIHQQHFPNYSIYQNILSVDAPSGRVLGYRVPHIGLSQKNAMKLCEDLKTNGMVNWKLASSEEVATLFSGSKVGESGSNIIQDMPDKRFLQPLFSEFSRLRKMERYQNTIVTRDSISESKNVSITIVKLYQSYFGSTTHRNMGHSDHLSFCTSTSVKDAMIFDQNSGEL